MENSFLWTNYIPQSPFFPAGICFCMFIVFILFKLLRNWVNGRQYTSWVKEQNLATTNKWISNFWQILGIWNQCATEWLSTGWPPTEPVACLDRTTPWGENSFRRISFSIRARPDWAYEFPYRTPKFAGQVLRDRTECRLLYSNILPYK